MSIDRRALGSLLAVLLIGCDGAAVDDAPPVVERPAPPAIVAEDVGPIDEISVADAPPRAAEAFVPGVAVEARLLVLSADGSEPELRAIRSTLDHAGVPHDVFVATAEPPLVAGRLASGAGGSYQGIVVASASLAMGGTTALSAAEWAVLAAYEASFGVRRAVLAAWPDPALGFGPFTTRDTSASPLGVSCTSVGRTVFRDVNCDATQAIAGDDAYLATPTSGAPLTPLLRDAAGHALAAVHAGGDGRESLLLLFRNDARRLHSLLFLHGVVGWVTGGTYLGERRIDLGVQIDDLFFGATLPGGGTFRLGAADLQAALAWVMARRARPSTPDLRASFAFNGAGAGAGDPLTQAAVAQGGEWFWINHTWGHGGLDIATYAETFEALARNVELAEDLPLLGFDVRDLVTPSVSGLVNPDAMRAAFDVGIRYAVTDTSRPGCDAPSPNTAFYDEVAPGILLVPRRPTNLFYDVSTPAEWVAAYNDAHRDHWGRDSTYAEVLDQESDVLLHYLMRGELDPWMFHQANLRAYDGARSLLGDLLDATLAKLEARLRVPVGSGPMHETGARFARRARAEASGVRATLFPGRALVLDAARVVTVPVTGVSPAAGEAYGGDVIGLVDVGPGASACVPVDAAGQGCDPAPVRTGGAGPARGLPIGLCDASSLPHPPPMVTIPRGSRWRYWDRGGDLGTAWRAPTFDDAGWSIGDGPLGYGEPYVETALSFGPSASAKHVTTYLRRTFVVDDPAAVTSMLAAVMYDDGFVAYLNGIEVGRAAMPSGTITATTLTGGHEAGNAYQTFVWTEARGALRAGVNVLAVEVHQASATSSDLVFDLALGVSPHTPQAPAEPEGVPPRSSWRFWDGGGELGTGWRTSSGGTGWDSGRGPLGYGEAFLQTVVSFGPSATSKHITTYFTTSFAVADPAAVSAMIGEVMYDDGFVVYLNGVEIGRAFMPGGAVTAATRSTGHETGDAYEAFDWSARRELLVAGTNTLAVEVHQVAPTSSDLAFDLALRLSP